MVSVHSWGRVALVNENYNVAVDVAGIDLKVYPVSDFNGNGIIRVHSYITVVGVHDKKECEVSIAN